ncbi:MAG: polysaccharide biosynthesis/export family protein [Hyphomicrobiaceae bacterium]
MWLDVIRRASSLLKASFAVGICASLLGCAGTGPSGRELLTAGAERDAPFALIEIDDRNIEIVSRWHRPTLGAMFGDYRGPRVQRIDTGDAVQITIWEAGAGGIFTAPTSTPNSPASRSTLIPEQVVSREGSINVPYAGRIKVTGKTPAEIETLIVTRLQGRATEPQALVTVTRSASHAVTVTGDVTGGARVPLSPRGDRILDVIATAGGVRAPVHEAFISITRDGTTLSVPMQVLLSNPTENIYLRPGDVVTVVRLPQSFTAVGATGRQAVVPFDAGGITLEEAVGKSGGLIDEKADPRAVFVLRFEPATLVKSYASVPPHLLAASVVPVAYHINLRDPAALFKARRFAMRDKDILYVSNAPVTELEKVLRLVGMVTGPTATGVAIRRNLE